MENKIQTTPRLKNRHTRFFSFRTSVGFSRSGFACWGIRYKGVFSSLSWVLCVSFGQICIAKNRLKLYLKPKFLDKRTWESTSKTVSGTAWTTVNTFPPNFIPLRPAQALRVTEWSTYWNGWNNYFKINKRRKSWTWRRLESSRHLSQGEIQRDRGSRCNKPRYLAQQI